jgi:hypothetical protein
MKLAVSLTLVVSLFLYGAHALPDIDGYTQFPSMSLESSPFERPMGVPDSSQQTPGIYTSTKGFYGKHLILTTICDEYPEGCDWHNGDVLGKHVQNASVSTYLKVIPGFLCAGHKTWHPLVCDPERFRVVPALSVIPAARERCRNKV